MRNLQKLVVVHQLLLVIQQKVQAGDILFIGKQGVSDIKTGNLPLLFAALGLVLKRRAVFLRCN